MKFVTLALMVLIIGCNAHKLPNNSVIHWEGERYPITTNVDIQSASFTVVLTGERKCTGAFSAVPIEQKTGNWLLTCPDELTAKGTYVFEAGKALRGIGADRKGRKIQFSRYTING